MRVAWVTDPHLNFLPYPAEFGRWLGASAPEAVLITGDVSEAPRLARDIEALSFGLGSGVSIWFVLGNHDAYRSSVAEAKKVARSLQQHKHIRYLSDADCAPIQLGESTWLVGVDGWYSAQAGEPFMSPIELSDFFLVSEFAVVAPGRPHMTRVPGLVAAARLLAFEEANAAKAKLRAVLAKQPTRVIFATHVPPYAEASFHEGALSDKFWVPWFSNLALGAVLDEAAEAHPDVQFTVLCGHMHSSGEYQRAANLLVRVGAAQYANPTMAAMYEFV